MKKERYTIRTEGSRTVIHWEGRSGKDVARISTSGRFVEEPAKTTTREVKPTRGTRKKDR